MAAMEEAGDEGDLPPTTKPGEPEVGEEASPEPTKRTWRAGTPVGQLMRSTAKAAPSPSAASPPAKRGKSAEPEEEAERERRSQAVEELSAATLPIANRRARDQEKSTTVDDDEELPDFEEELRWKEEQEQMEKEEEAKRLASHFEVDEEAPLPAQTKSTALFDKNKKPEHHYIATPGPGAAAGHEGEGEGEHGLKRDNSRSLSSRATARPARRPRHTDAQDDRSLLQPQKNQSRSEDEEEHGDRTRSPRRSSKEKEKAKLAREEEQKQPERNWADKNWKGFFQRQDLTEKEKDTHHRGGRKDESDVEL